jgi:hypothetical protein
MQFPQDKIKNPQKFKSGQGLGNSKGEDEKVSGGSLLWVPRKWTGGQCWSQVEATEVFREPKGRQTGTIRTSRDNAGAGPPKPAQGSSHHCLRPSHCY